MKSIIVFSIVISLFCSGNVVSQQKMASISFDKELHDFKTIKEDDGPVTCIFNVTNTGSQPLIIKNVKPSCGCTSPDWTKTPIAPGKAGYIKATYNPRNRPGKFHKTLTVLSNSETPTKVLIIQGKVIPKPKEIRDMFPQQMGDLRLKTNHVAFVKIKNTETKTDSILVLNDGLEDIKLSFDKVPGHIKIYAKPEVIKPKQKGLIVVSYDARLKKNAKGQQDWGFLIDRLNVIVNNNNDPRNRLSVSATIEEDFSYLSKEDLAKAPSIKFENTVFEYGTITEGESVSYEFKFKNEGKMPLELRKIKASCGCTAISTSETTIAPGKTSSIKTTFNSRGKYGKQNKTITVISNDPAHSVIKLRITGEVKKQ